MYYRRLLIYNERWWAVRRMIVVNLKIMTFEMLLCSKMNGFDLYLYLEGTRVTFRQSLRHVLRSKFVFVRVLFLSMYYY